MNRPFVERALDLPTSVFGVILCRWLNLKSVCRLDSAICERTNRAAFLNLLASVECIGQLCAFKNEQLVWMNMRLVKSKKFVWLGSFTDDECEKFLRRSGHCVQNCRISFGGSVSVVAQYCHNLLRFTARHVGSCSELLKANPKLVDLTLICSAFNTDADNMMPNVKHISLVGATFNNNFCIRLVKGTSSLRSLCLSFTSITSTCVIEAVRFCPLLRSIEPPDLPDIDNTLSEIALTCPNIEDMCLTYCNSLTNAGIVAVAQNLKALRSIDFRLNSNITNVCLLALAKHQYETLKVVMVADRYNANLMAGGNGTNIDAFNASNAAIFRGKCAKLHVFEWERALNGLTEENNDVIISHVINAGMVTTLILSYVDDVILDTIAPHCAKLQVLNLWHVRTDTIDACSDLMWLQVVQQCSHLNSIIVSGANQCNKLRTLLAEYPRVQILN